MGLFGWSLPPGCGTLPGEEPEQPIQLHEDKTLIGYGRRGHGLNGKDADLDPYGQLVVKEAWWHADGTLEIHARGYASLVPAEIDSLCEALKKFEGKDLDPDSDEASDAHASYMDYCHEVVCGDGYEGEWDGDYWVLGHDIHLKLDLQWDDELTEEQNKNKALALAYQELEKDNAEFEKAMRACNEAMDPRIYLGYDYPLPRFYFDYAYPLPRFYVRHHTACRDRLKERRDQGRRKFESKFWGVWERKLNKWDRIHMVKRKRPVAQTNLQRWRTQAA